MEILQSEESVKLYEYYQPQPELNDEFIEHFGILGMHWGQRNGPPYPLSSVISTGRRLKAAAKAGSVKRKRRKAIKKAQVTKAKKAMEKRTKEDIIKSKDLKSMLANVDKFTNKEIEDMLSRLNVEDRLREKVAQQEKSKKTWGKKVRDNISTAVKEEIPKTIGEMTRTATNKGIKLAGNRVLKEIVGPEATNKYDDKWQDIIDQLIPDPLGQKKKEKK